MPRRGGLTTTRSGARGGGGRRGVADLEGDRARGMPRRRHPRDAPPPPGRRRPPRRRSRRRPRCGRGRWRAGRNRPPRSRGPTPPSGSASSTHSRACRYSAPATTVLVWKNDFGPSSRVTSPTRTGSSVCAVSGTSVSPSSTALCSGCRLAVTTRTDGRSASRVGSAARRSARCRSRAQHEAHQLLAVGGVRDDEVLQLAASRGDVVGLEPEVGDEPVQRVEGRGQAGFVEPAAAQVDAAAALVEDAEGGASAAAAHDQLGLVAVVRGGAARGFEPVQPPGATSASAAVAARLLVGELGGVGRAHQGARAAAAGVEVVALHGAASLGAPTRSGSGRSPADRILGCFPSRVAVPVVANRLCSGIRRR